MISHESMALFSALSDVGISKRFGGKGGWGAVAFEAFVRMVLKLLWFEVSGVPGSVSLFTPFP